MCPHLSVLITQTLCFHSPLHDTQQPNPSLGIIFILIQNIHANLHPAPRARLLSLCTATLESFRVSLSMALRRPVYSDWSIGYMPEGREE